MAEDDEHDEVPNLEVCEGQPAGPSHDPYSFKLLTIVQKQQCANGLRHSDHLRYRQYCSRRLRRLYTLLKFKHGKGRYRATPFPSDFQDVRFLEIPLVTAERAWSYGMQLKTDNANASAINARWRHHSINRFAKAAQWAKLLEAVCKAHTDQRTQMEAEAYSAYMQGVWLAEKENWEDAHARIVRCKKVCDYLSVASGPDESAFLKTKIQELEPLLRECKYNLGLAYDENEGAEERSAMRKSSDVTGWSYRGQGVAVPSAKIKDRLVMCIASSNELKAIAETKDGSDIIEKYGRVSVEFSDVLKDIHGEMIKVGADGKTYEWKMLEAFVRQYSISMNLERNLSLLMNQLLKLEPLEDMTTSEARRACKPEEGVRYCDMLKSDLNFLGELPETTETVSSVLSTYMAIIVNCRCLFLALCYTSLGKILEGAALMDMLHARIEDVTMCGSLEDPVGRLHSLFETIHEGLPAWVAKWRCRGLAQICAAGLNKAAVPGTAGGGALQRVDVKNFAIFPPRFRDVPCKPLLFDLAFQSIVQPDITSFLEQRKAADQKGLLGKVAGVAGGLGSRLTGLWGRK